MHPTLLGEQLLLEALELAAAIADERELALDHGVGLEQDLAAALAVVGAVELGAQLGAHVLGLDELAQLLKRRPQQVAQAQQLLEALDVGLLVDAMAPGLPVPAAGQQADLLVV